MLVITGSPRVGKSTVLGRIVTTADAQTVAALPTDDDAIRAGIGSVACAVYAKGKTALDVAMEIARAASAPLPERCTTCSPEPGQRVEILVEAKWSAPEVRRGLITRATARIRGGG